MRLVPGEAFGRYRIEAEIGRGGQAIVYRATQLDLDRQVALKVFDEGYLGRAGAIERFRREAIAAGRLEHPRIVPVYDAGEIEGRAYIAMRLIPGDTLAERIARGGALAPEHALAVLSDIAEAIDFAHARGTVHRDVKPGNILLEPGGASYLSDFGLVRLDDMPGLTRRGDWLGTAEYVSPEQVEGEPGTERSDLYALAAVAYEALTGRPPYPRREASAVLLAHVREPAPEATAANAALPVAVDEVLARGLAKDPADRPPDARRLVDELRHALGSGVLRPTVVGAPAPAAGDDPWDAALARISGDEAGGRTDPPTEAFGDASRRRAIAMGRDLMVVALVGLVVLLAGAMLGGWALGNSQADASGAEARGYADGEKAGRQAGFVAGEAKGRKAGVREGRTAGRKAGFTDGREQGREEGREAGYTDGVADGRDAALGGLDPGAWYVVRVGEDEAGPVIAGSSPVEPDAGQCYTVSGETVLSGPC